MAGNGDIQTNRATYDKVLTLLKVGGAVAVVIGLLVAAVLAAR